jgi:preprotein translocase subunit SecA
MSETASGQLSLPRVEAWPERATRKISPLDRFAHGVAAVLVAQGNRRRGRAAMQVVPEVEAFGEPCARLAGDDLKRRAESLRPTLRRNPRDRRAVAEGFALVREAATRTIGRRHYDVQLAGGWALMQGMVAEMEPGEGRP